MLKLIFSRNREIRLVCNNQSTSELDMYYQKGTLDIFVIFYGNATELDTKLLFKEITIQEVSKMSVM